MERKNEFEGSGMEFLTSTTRQEKEPEISPSNLLGENKQDIEKVIQSPRFRVTYTNQTVQTHTVGLGKTNERVAKTNTNTSNSEKAAQAFPYGDISGHYSSPLIRPPPSLELG